MQSSNHPEICPLCLEYLKTRFGAMSHYRAHVRKGELDGWCPTENHKPSKFKFVDHKDQQGAWWERGMNYNMLFGVGNRKQKELEMAQRRFIMKHEYPKLARMYRQTR